MSQYKSLSFTMLTLSLLAFGSIACTTTDNQKKDSDNPTPQTKKEDKLAIASKDAIMTRVKASQARLEKSEAGKLIWKAMNAQGGLKNWFDEGPIGFRFKYQPVGKNARDTYQVVDTFSSRARHQMYADKTIEFGWDGKTAWKKHTADQKMTMNARFWSLTPYYFVAMPFVLGDPGINLTKLDDTNVDGITYHRVKATYEANIGDSPDDYYIAYINLKTGRMDALGYIVTYKGFFPNGGKTAEKIMLYLGSQKIKGITLPTRFETYSMTEGKKDKKVTDTTLTEVSFLPQTKDAYFMVPEGAQVVKKMK